MTATLYAMDSSNSAHNNDRGDLLDYVEVTTSDNPLYSVIWLHGLGADGHDFEPIVPYLGLASDLAVRFIFPHALRRPVTVNGGAVMRAWYDIIEISTSKGQDEAGIRHSAAKVDALIEFEISRGIPASRIILAGFSQGGAMALHVGLRYPKKLAGIMALSAYLMIPKETPEQLAKADEKVLTDFQDVESFYVNEISDKVSLINGFENNEGLNGFTHNFQQLDAMYMVLKEEMKNSPSTKVKEALVLNLLIQIDLLNKQLDKLDPGEEQEKVDEKIS